jgi:phthalate 4,5-cis-dihydrodiol dehydrogenase
VKRAFPVYDIESNYSAFLTFENDATALIDFNGLGHLDIAEMTWGIGEGGGIHRDADMYGARPKPKGPVSVEVRYASPQYAFGCGLHTALEHLPKNQDFFGITIVSCERGDIRQSPEGLYVYTEDGRGEVEVDADLNTRGFTELRELSAALEEKRPVFPNHLWGRASLEACVAMIESSRLKREVELKYQVPSPLNTGTYR